MEKTIKKAIEQSGVRKGSPMEGWGPWLHRLHSSSSSSSLAAAAAAEA